MNKLLVKAGLILLSGLALHMPVQAQSAPEISPVMKKMLAALPLTDLKEEVGKMIGTLKNSPCGGGLRLRSTRLPASTKIQDLAALAPIKPTRL